MDEVQLMGVGLTTGSQIQAFWEHRRAKAIQGINCHEQRGG